MNTFTKHFTLAQQSNIIVDEIEIMNDLSNIFYSIQLSEDEATVFSVYDFISANVLTEDEALDVDLMLCFVPTADQILATLHYLDRDVEIEQLEADAESRVCESCDDVAPWDLYSARLYAQLDTMRKRARELNVTSMINFFDEMCRFVNLRECNQYKLCFDHHERTLKRAETSLVVVSRAVVLDSIKEKSVAL